ncbi:MULTISPECIES: DUF4401 domain-containing protein [Pseudomonadati]|uniref:DUF4401 domain-containing protein n=1 Tax=Shewanella aestuarii TaxID=1028752 RepID=A0ABT0L1G2_9GAMM|nr:DUF4401 domain-containing protein [Shewanella aestuarii]MCL1117525.1 DUF4401 domain-containing protein [Shewanella aestuarii]GGN75529.1 hypothetical protein GCM10009193_15870 [Shewanella aestuarii]
MSNLVNHPMSQSGKAPVQAAPAQLWRSLFNQGLVDNDSPPAMKLSSPWYIIGAQMIGGWIAALFLLAFLLTSMASIDNIEQSILAIGILITLGCLTYYRVGNHNQEFILQMVFAFSIAGQLMLLWGIHDTLKQTDDDIIALMYAVVFALHWWLIPHKTNQFIAAIAMVPCLLAILVIQQLTQLVLPLLIVSLMLVWSQRYYWPKCYQRMRMLGYALGLNLLFANFALSDMGLWIDLPQVLITFDSRFSHYLAVIMVLLSALWLIHNIFKQLSSHLIAPTNTTQLRQVKIISILSAILISLLSIPMAGISTALLMLLIGFFYNELKLFALAIGALVSFIGLYYYSLHISLFDKSLWLMASGVMLLLIRWALAVSVGKTISNQEQRHDIQ